MKRHIVIKSVLHDAERIVNGPRSDYGDMRKVHQSIADLWSAYLGILDAPIEAADVAQMMSLLKKVRAKHGLFKRDNYVDDTGYTVIAAALDAEDASEEPPDAPEPTLDEMVERINNGQTDYKHSKHG